MIRAYARLGAFLLVALGAALLAPSTALGHADYESSVPNANEVVATPPSQIEVFFTQEVVRQEGANFVRVFDDSETQVSDGDGVVSDDNRALITATFPAPLAEGRYIVQWKTLSDGDGDEDSGAFCFFVVTQPTAEESAECAELQEAEPEGTTGAPTTGGVATPAATSVEPQPTDDGGESEDGDDSSNTGVIIGIVVAIVAIAAVGGGAFYYMRQRQQG